MDPLESQDDSAPLPQSTSDPNQEFADEDVRSVAELFGISNDAARARLSAENEASRLQPLLMDRYPRRFAGMWMDLDGSTNIHVSFTGSPRSLEDEVRAMSQRPQDLVFHSARRSLEDLRSVQARMIADRAGLQRNEHASQFGPAQRASQGQYDIEIDLPTNSITVFSHRSDRGAMASEMAQLYAADVRARPGGSAPAACTPPAGDPRNDCRYQMRGGIKLTLPDGSFCSAGFIAQARSDPNRRFVLSAAHCGSPPPSFPPTNDVGQQRFNGGSYYGTVHGNFQVDQVDAERIINDTGDDLFTANDWINYNDIYLDPGVYRAITGWKGYSGIVLNTTLYGKSGARTGNTQGYVTSNTFAPTYVPNGNSFLRTTMCIQPGDSGAPVYRVNDAIGLVSGMSTDVNGNAIPCGVAGYYGIFGSIEFVQNVLSVNLS